MKNEWKWLTLFGLISILIVGIIIDFKFADPEIQKGNMFFGYSAIAIIIYSTLALWTFKNMYLLIDLMTTRYKILAVLISIINPLVALLLFILLYMNVEVLIPSGKFQSVKDFITQIIPVTILVGLMTFQTIVEIKTIRKTLAFLKDGEQIYGVRK